MSDGGRGCCLGVLASLAFWLVAGLLVVLLWDDLVTIARSF